MKLEPLQLIRRAWSPTRQTGFSLVEIILSSAIFVMLVTAFVGAYLYGEEATMLAGNRLRATLLAEEAIEAVRNMRDPAFSNLADGTFGLSISGNQWLLSGSQDVSGLFTRNVTIATIDSKRKSVTSHVTWQQNPQRTGSVTLVSGLTNWIIAVASDWTTPTQAASLDMTGTADGFKVQVLGNYAYVIRSATSANFSIIDITNPAAPVVRSTLSLNGTPKNIVVDGTYAYIASDSDTQELQIVNIASPVAPLLSGSYNSTGNQNASGISVSGNTAFLARKNGPDIELLVINVTNHAAPALIGSLELGANANDLVVSGNYLFVTSDNNAQELKVVNISNPATPTLVGSLDLLGNTDGEAIAISGNTVVMSQGSLLFTVDVSNPIVPVQRGSISAGALINDIALNLGGAGSYVYLATSNTANEFRVADISVLTTPTIRGSFNLAGTTSNLFGVAYDTVGNRAYGVGQLNTAEFDVFAPQ